MLRYVLTCYPILLFLCSVALRDSDSCDGLIEAREATVDEIRDFITARKMSVLTFTGYSGSGYEDPDAMLREASRFLDSADPARTLINIGATSDGIGAVYEIAKQRGFTTIGIVSILACDELTEISKCVDYVFFVRDETWGGLIEGTDQLSPTSAAIVETGTTFVAIGGGDVARDEMLAARRAGKNVTFIPADMNHSSAIEKAKKKGLPEPVDFRGSAHEALAGGH